MTDINQLSDYAKFHLKFMGYHFYDTYRGCIINKYALWHSKQQLCMAMLNNRVRVGRFSLIDKVGWIDGKRIVIKKRIRI